MHWSIFLKPAHQLRLGYMQTPGLLSILVASDGTVAEARLWSMSAAESARTPC